MTDPKGHDPLAELFGEFPDRLRGDRWQPAVDVFETEQAVVVRAELPGVRAEDLRLSVHGNLLTIRGSRSVPGGADVRRLHQVEIALGPFERALRMPLSFDRNRVSAHLEDGLLEITLPKRAPMRIEVETE